LKGFSPLMYSCAILSIPATGIRWFPRGSPCQWFGSGPGTRG
jgi:hypothetical protein